MLFFQVKRDCAQHLKFPDIQRFNVIRDFVTSEFPNISLEFIATIYVELAPKKLDDSLNMPAPHPRRCRNDVRLRHGAQCFLSEFVAAVHWSAHCAVCPTNSG